MITMLRIGTRSCVHHLTSGSRRSIGRLVQVGNIELRGSIGRQRDLDGISWKSSARWRHTATAEAQKEEEEEETEQNPQEPDDEAPSSTLPSSTVDLKTPISLPSPTSQTPVEEDETIHVLRAQYDLPAYLRPYQVQVIDACMKALARGVKRIGVSCPTGSGKTVIFTNLIPLLRNLPAYPTSPTSPSSTSTSISPSNNLDSELESSSRRPKRPDQILILVGAIELAHQAMSTIKKAFPGLNVELEQGKSKGSGKADVTVATYHSLKGPRLERYDPEDFVGVIVDEAHHAAAPSYLKLLHYFNRDVKPRKRTTEDELVGEMDRPIGAFGSSDTSVDSHVRLQSDESVERSVDTQAKTDELERGPRAAIIGFTATFSRHDQQALDTVFDEIVYHQDVWDMLQAGWLAPARFTTVKAHMDLADVAVNEGTGDFVKKKLSGKVNQPEVNELVVRTWLDRAAGRKSTLVFCVDLTHVEVLTEAFRQRGVDARWVSSKTHERERKALIEAFRAQEFPVLVNCEILTEGTDIPNIDTIIIARPTKSRNLFSQMIGRGLRNHPGKVDCRIIDLVDNVTNVDGLVSAPTLFGLDPVNADVQDASINELKVRGEEARAIEEAEQQNLIPDRVTYVDDDDPFRFRERDPKQDKAKSKFSWVSCGGDKYVLEAFGNGYFSIIKQRNQFLVRHAAQLPTELRGKSRNPYGMISVKGTAQTLAHAMAMGDRLVESYVPRTLHPKLYKWAEWRSRPASSKQIEHLRERGLIKGDSEDGFDVESMTSGKAASIMTALIHGAKGRATKQAKQIDMSKKQKERLAKKATLRRTNETVTVGKLSRSSY